ncbi:MAG: hypothetical protein AB8B61_06560 [Cyclobacteriaceae bacterium]
MDISIIKLLPDMGLFTLIWMVQLVTYPGFVSASEADMKRWHPIYTGRITIIVLPLMLAQLVLHGYGCYLQVSCIKIISLVLIVGCWLATFLVSVPLHQKIDAASDSLETRKKLVKTNWMRTVAWTILLLLNLFYYGS